MKLPMLLASACFALCCAGQQAPDVGAEADTAYQAQHWQQAEKLYQQLIESHPAVGRYWYRLGVSQHKAGHNLEALATFQSAKAKDFPSFFVDVGLAVNPDSVTAQTEPPHEAAALAGV